MKPNSMRTAILMAGLSISLFAQADRVPAGTEITVRTNDRIDAKRPSDSRIYTGVVDRDVLDNSGRVVIPRGSNAELIMRDASENEIVLDLESVDVNGRRYTVSSSPESVTGDRDRK